MLFAIFGLSSRKKLDSQTSTRSGRAARKKEKIDRLNAAVENEKRARYIVPKKKKEKRRCVAALFVSVPKKKRSGLVAIFNFLAVLPPFLPSSGEILRLCASNFAPGRCVTVFKVPN